MSNRDASEERCPKCGKIVNLADTTLILATRAYHPHCCDSSELSLPANVRQLQTLSMGGIALTALRQLCDVVFLPINHDPTRDPDSWISRQTVIEAILKTASEDIGFISDGMLPQFRKTN